MAPDIGPGTREGDTHEIKSPREVNPDRDKTVFDPETGEWKTINEAKKQAEERAEEKYWQRAHQGELPPADGGMQDRLIDQEATVFNPETREWQTIDAARRRAAARLAGMETGVGFLEEDVGKPLVSGHVMDEYGTVVDVKQGCATIQIRSGVRRMAASAFEKRFPEVEELYDFKVYRVPPSSKWVKEINEDAVVIEF